MYLCCICRSYVLIHWICTKNGLAVNLHWTEQQEFEWILIWNGFLTCIQTRNLIPRIHVIQLASKTKSYDWSFCFPNQKGHRYLNTHKSGVCKCKIKSLTCCLPPWRPRPSAPLHYIPINRKEGANKLQNKYFQIKKSSKRKGWTC